MKINLTDENMKQVDRGEYLIVDGEVWNQVGEETKEFTERGMHQYFYYKQPATDKVFVIDLFAKLERCEDSGFDDCYVVDRNKQRKVAVEVEKKIFQQTRWVEVNDNEN